ncbi:siphovirus Gp157 family protein [Mesorhizobium sp. Cs1299R1N3]|uniref:siphovirus Gp157 family protein n=1 Tax=Mesorhizobium sp. Cs1299R1N3 TaxID=3015173 RepID=UPI00301D0111
MKHEHDEHKARLQIEAAKRLIADMREQNGADIFDGDEGFLIDAIEGETSLIEVITAALNSRDEDLMMLTGIEAKQEELATRKKRLEATAERKKSLIEKAMLAAEIKTLPLPVATLSISNRAPGLLVVEESDIPSAYFKTPEPPAPKLDKKALTSALRDRKAKLDAAIEAAKAFDDEERKAAIEAAAKAFPPIPGAELDNGSVSLAIRVK